MSETAVALKWDEPEDDGGRPITGYVIERKDTSRASWNNSMSSKTTGTTTWRAL